MNYIVTSRMHNVDANYKIGTSRYETERSETKKTDLSVTCGQKLLKDELKVNTAIVKI